MSDTLALTADGLDYRTAGNDVVVHDSVRERVHVLNKTAAFILQSCDGRRSAAAIAAELTMCTGAPSDRTLPDVQRALSELRSLHLIA
jgi:hypothetical protein